MLAAGIFPVSSLSLSLSLSFSFSLSASSPSRGSSAAAAAAAAATASVTRAPARIQRPGRRITPPAANKAGGWRPRQFARRATTLFGPHRPPQGAAKGEAAWDMPRCEKKTLVSGAHWKSPSIGESPRAGESQAGRRGRGDADKISGAARAQTPLGEEYTHPRAPRSPTAAAAEATAGRARMWARALFCARDRTVTANTVRKTKLRKFPAGPGEATENHFTFASGGWGYPPDPH